MSRLDWMRGRRTGQRLHRDEGGAIEFLRVPETAAGAQ